MKAVLDGVVKEGATGINGLVFVAVDRKGDTLVQHASGTRSIASKEPMDMDTTFCKPSFHVFAYGFPRRQHTNFMFDLP